jgi:sortase A
VAPAAGADVSARSPASVPLDDGGIDVVEREEMLDDIAHLEESRADLARRFLGRRPNRTRQKPSEDGDARSDEDIIARPLARRLGQVLTFVAVLMLLFAAFEFLASDVSENRSQRALLREFSLGLVTGTAAQLGGLPVRGQPVAVIKIPSIGLEKVVIEGTDPASLKQGPGHFRNTPLPGQFGNSVIMGRRTTYGSPFARLTDVAIGDDIEVTTAEGTFHYTVASTGAVQPGQTDVLTSTARTQLTVVTSDPALLVKGRVGVIAQLVGDPLAAPILFHAVTLEEDESGMSGDMNAIFGTVFWLALMLLAVWIATRLYRIWSPMATYLITTPIILVLVFVSFEHLDLLLPGSI